MSQALKFDFGEIPASSVNRSVVERVQKFRPVELVAGEQKNSVL
jgi:hypothetical protein